MLDNARSSDLPGYLDDAAACIVEAWPQGHPALRSLDALRERLAEARLQVAILGQFKRGKSTVINALLRDSLLPTAVVPATAIPTFIAWDAAPRIRVAFKDDRRRSPPSTRGSSSPLTDALGIPLESCF